MHPFTVLSLWLPFLAFPAQTTNGQTAVVQVQKPAPGGCPVDFSVRHANQGETIQVSPGRSKPQQAYRLRFQPLAGHGIVQAKVTLHGLSGAQIIPVGKPGSADDASHPAPDATETLNTSPSAAGHHLFQSTIYTEKLTGVQWVELNQLTWTDGAVWQEAAPGACRVVPDGFMLVDGSK